MRQKRRAESIDIHHDRMYDLPTNDKESSPDPFNVYDLLQKQDERKNVVESDTSISHPPGFTQEKDVSQSKVPRGTCLNKGGSILDALDDMIKVGQIMGYDMDGCVKDMERIIGSQGVNERTDIITKLRDIDIQLDQGGVNDDILLDRMRLMKQLHDIKSLDSNAQNLAIKRRLCGRYNGWMIQSISDQADLLELPISAVEIRNAVWACGENKSPGPDGFTFEFFRKFWDVLGKDFSLAIMWFFYHCSFAKGCNSSFIALIPKCIDPKFVNNYRPISLIGSLYKVVTKILAIRLSSVLNNLISEVQSAFLPNRQILDGSFIINELLSWCKLKKKQAMLFKVDFAKAYDSIRWDFLDDILCSFGFGSKWRSWISGSLASGKASVLVNGSPTSEFQFHCGLKQGDPLAPYLFLLVMESLHYSFSRVVEAGFFKGISFNESVNISHLFYADDAVFIVNVQEVKFIRVKAAPHCFSLGTG
ncbi:RNA-directed DNA polymerase, eukaryota [Tanacetum coccineum]|uniref:RNA-directed DNA polymerase, eukaryota n=1 Tax=Tanacetum coccineum TaxID=301880 RepID=A0ABQ4YXZ5_9ASTR